MRLTAEHLARLSPRLRMTVCNDCGKVTSTSPCADCQPEPDEWVDLAAMRGVPGLTRETALRLPSASRPCRVCDAWFVVPQIIRQRSTNKWLYVYSERQTCSITCSHKTMASAASISNHDRGVSRG